ncbi:hypothetical protein SLA2020_282830 [Shorea laevis]
MRICYLPYKCKHTDGNGCIYRTTQRHPNCHDDDSTIDLQPQSSGKTPSPQCQHHHKGEQKGKKRTDNNGRESKARKKRKTIH